MTASSTMPKRAATASQSFVPGVAWKHHACSNDGNVGERTTTQTYST